MVIFECSILGEKMHSEQKGRDDQVEKEGPTDDLLSYPEKNSLVATRSAGARRYMMERKRETLRGEIRKGGGRKGVGEEKGKGAKMVNASCFRSPRLKPAKESENLLSHQVGSATGKRVGEQDRGPLLCAAEHGGEKKIGVREEDLREPLLQGAEAHKRSGHSIS